MNDYLDRSVELAAERSSIWDSSEKLLRKSIFYSRVLEEQLKKLGLKSSPSDTIIDSLSSLKHDAINTLDALIESDYKYFDDCTLSSDLYLLDLTDDDLNKYVKTFRGLKEKLCYKTVNIGNSDQQLSQIDYIFKISRFKGDVYKAIDALAKTGYSLKTIYGKKEINYKDVDIIKDLAKADIDNFLIVFDKIKEKLSYKDLNKHEDPYYELRNIILLSQIRNIPKVIDALAKVGYELNEFLYKGSLRDSDVRFIHDLAEFNLEKYLEGYRFLNKRFGVSKLNDYTASELLDILRINDQVLKTMEVLADSGYALEKIGSVMFLQYSDIDLIRKLSCPNSLEHFLQNLSKLKEAAGYTKIAKLFGKKIVLGDNPKGRVKYLAEPALDMLNLSGLEGDVFGAINALVKSGYEIKFSNKKLFDKSLVEKLARYDVKKYSAIFDKLKEKFNYKTVNVRDEWLGQTDRMMELLWSGGDVPKAIDVLAESDYKLEKMSGKAWMCLNDRRTIQKVAINGPEKYIKVFRKLKEKLGYKTVRVKSDNLNEKSYDQVEKIIEISRIPGNVCEAIDILAEEKRYVDMLPPCGVFEKYKIDKKQGITNEDMGRIQSISERLWKKSLEGINSCFYKENSGSFIECFQQLNTNDKKRVIRTIFKCDKASNEEIIKWLDENEPSLVREVGLE